MAAPAALVGPTATGKSAVALELGRRDGSWEIVSVDSMQVYRGMDIGTAKPTTAERDEIAHHVVDVADPWEPYDLASFQSAAEAAVADIERRGHRPLLVGGTALYLRAVVDSLTMPGRYPEVRAELDRDPDTGALHRRLAEVDPVAAARMEPTNRRRIVRALEVSLGSGHPFSSFGPGLDQHPPTRFCLVGLSLSRAELDRRIEARYRSQLAAGFLDEVRSLREGRTWSHTAAQALGYKELAAHLDGEMSLEEAVDLAIRRTRRFARRQQRWLRRDPRIAWVDVEGRETSDVAAAVEEVLASGGGTMERSCT